MRMMAPRMPPRVPTSIRIASPSVLSMVSISFENRFMIRPRGCGNGLEVITKCYDERQLTVVSKNDMGAYMTRWIAAL